ncbi:MULTISPECIES: LLM class flavin-dependent oxidoreductase [Pimelobacter]|uniref:LLM class flavin-dependent oxidoreductase n=1 Tax=Pimelobacter TaxID=2044 RepID=UPI001C05C9B4|nr:MULTISPECIES: LLM class flavin-dependent oxidoreductase [Pimelobacter]MBU2695448.1 hypothetical protein [Pimelobacter sp. 30-1]UUW91177.1 LLM class flavin-dependent oxidoreductase [Pimelobacter simplex]UUW95005.1 LLM class flavin-dependent oxidoreductase [Pimelobacter simplex]
MKISIRLSSDLSPERVLEGADGAAAAGLSGVWLADNPLERSAPISAAVIAARHPQLDIGLGIVSARDRHPVVLTQEMVALQSYTRGRVAVGLGLQSDEHRKLLGLPARSGLELLRTTAGLITELSAGREVPALGEGEGTIRLKVTADAPLPVFVGAMGPKTLALAGEVAHGAVLSLGTTAAAARDALGTARAHFTPSEVADHFDGVCYVGFGGVGEGSYARLETFAAGYLRIIVAHPFLSMLLDGTGLDLAQAAEVVAAYDAGTPVPREVVTVMGIGGSLEECLDQLQAYADAGVDDVALGIGLWNDTLPATLADVATLARAWSQR